MRIPFNLEFFIFFFIYRHLLTNREREGSEVKSAHSTNIFKRCVGVSVKYMKTIKIGLFKFLPIDKIRQITILLQFLKKTGLLYKAAITQNDVTRQNRQLQS